MRIAAPLLVLVLATASGRADPEPAPPAPQAPPSASEGTSAQVDKLFDEGRKLLDDNKPAAACEKFDEAIKLDDTAVGVMLNIGLCNEELHKYATALLWFRKAQAMGAEKHLPDHEATAKEHTKKLAELVATITIVVVADGGAPPNTHVKIDGKEIAPEQFGHVEIDPGQHVLDAGAPGFKNVHIELGVEGRGGQTYRVPLVAGENTVVIDPGKGRRRIALFTAIGGGALWVSSGIVGLVAKSRYDATKGDPTKGTPPDLRANQRAIDLAKYWGTGLFVAGAVAFGAAAVIYFTAPQPEKIDQTVFVPTLSPDGGGIAVSGRF